MISTLLLFGLLAQAPAREAESGELRERARAATLELEAAKSGKLYLVAKGSSSVELKLWGVLLERLPLQSIDVGLRFGTSPKGDELGPRFTCRAPGGPAPQEIRPGEAASVEPPPAAPPAPIAVECDPSLEVRFLPASALGLGSYLGDRFGASAGSPIRVVVRLEDAAAARLRAVLPETFELIFVTSETP